MMLRKLHNTLITKISNSMVDSEDVNSVINNVTNGAGPESVITTLKLGKELTQKMINKESMDCEATRSSSFSDRFTNILRMDPFKWDIDGMSLRDYINVDVMVSFS